MSTFVLPVKGAPKDRLCAALEQDQLTEKHTDCKIMKKGIQRADFPCLHEQMIYLNSAFTALTPDPVVQKLSEYYSTRRHSPVGQNIGINEEIKYAYQRIAKFIHATNENGLVFTKNCTEALNYIANCLKHQWSDKDNIVISQMEYLPNILPWFRIKERYGVELRVAPLTHDNTIDIDTLSQLIDQQTRIVSIIYVSNFYGTENAIPEICSIAHKQGAFVVVDAAQAITQIPVNVHQLGCDFLAFSGHKALGPTGSGILWIKETLFDSIEPQMLGDAGAELDLHTDSYSLHHDYRRYWGGFSDVAGILGLSYALEYVEHIGIETIQQHNSALLQYFVESLHSYQFIHCFSPISGNSPIAVVSFTPTKGITAKILAEQYWEHGIILQLLEMSELPYLRQKLDRDYCLRVSVHFYNEQQDINKVLRVLDGIDKSL